ncbi:MAG: NYN domain-containing protein [Planctomycetota bacterium]
MIFLVDGYNYLHRARLLGGDLRRARLALLGRLSVLAGDRNRVHVVWDAERGTREGTAPRDGGVLESRGRVESVFARNCTADDEILAWIRSSEKAASLCVVTDDRELFGRAEQLGARTMRVAEVEERFAKKGRKVVGTGRREEDPAGEAAESEKPRAPRGSEVKEWLDYFGATEEET